MKCQRLWIIVLAAAAGCGDGFAPMGSPGDERVEPLGNVPRSTALSEGGITLSYYDQSTETGETPPTFTIKSDELLAQENDVYTFRDAESVIYTQDGDHLYVDAASVWLNYGEKRAIMDQGVTLRRGAMRIELQELEWNNGDRTAVSNKPLVVTDGDTRIEANTMSYFPDERRLVLREAGGRIAGLGGAPL